MNENKFNGFYAHRNWCRRIPDWCQWMVNQFRNSSVSCHGDDPTRKRFDRRIQSSDCNYLQEKNVKISSSLKNWVQLHTIASELRQRFDGVLQIGEIQDTLHRIVVRHFETVFAKTTSCPCHRLFTPTHHDVRRILDTNKIDRGRESLDRIQIDRFDGELTFTICHAP